MQFRRNGLRDERRRRALMDDRAGDSSKGQASVDSSNGGCQSTRSYSKSAVDERRVRIVDVVPIYVVHLTLMYVAIVMVVAGVLALDHYLGRVIRWADLTRVDSLATYLTAGSLFAGSLLAVLIYRIRRHRLDDYRGYYHCWLWFAGLLLFASLDSMLNFRQDVASGLETASKLRFFGQTDGWWAVVWCVGFGSMGLRAMIEVRESYGTLAVAILSSLLLVTGLTLQLDLVILPSSLPAELTLHAAKLLGVGLLLASLVQYSRYVWLDAQGLISRTVRIAAEDEEESAEVPAEAKKKVAPKKSRAVAKKQAAESTEEEEESVEEKPRRGWFSFGRKKVEESETEESVEPTAARSRTSKKEAEEQEQLTQPKRGWFSFGRKQDPEEPEDAEEAKPIAAKKRAASKPDTDEAIEDDAAEVKPKRSWFGFGRKNDNETAEETPKVGATSKPEAETDAEEPVKKKGWFSWGSKAEADGDATEKPESEESRTTMTPRITTRPKAAPTPAKETPPKPAPVREVPTITGKNLSPQDDGDNSAEDEEILRLEAKPDHQLSKAERRRLKKLKRRAAA